MQIYWLGGMVAWSNLVNPNAAQVIRRLHRVMKGQWGFGRRAISSFYL
jgi:hypothetical protein